MGLFARMGLGASACVALLSGCASLESISAGHVGCPADEVEISEHDKGWGQSTWIATCRGKRYHCSAYSTGENNAQVSCSPEAGTAKATAGPTSGGDAPARQSSAASRSPREDVERILRRSDGVEKAYIEARLSPEPFELRVFRVADKRGDSNIVTRMEAPLGAHGQCTLRVMVDGELTELEKAAYRRNGSLEEVSSRLPEDLLQRMASAERVAGRVCSDEWRLDDYDRQVLQEYVARLKEESAWSGEAQAPSAAEPESGEGAADAGIQGGDAGVGPAPEAASDDPTELSAPDGT